MAPAAPQVTDMLEQAGPRTFFVFRYFRGGLQISDGSEEMSPWRRMPPLTTSEARQIASLPGVRFVAYGEHADAAVEVGTERLSSVRVGGFNHAWPQASGGDVFSGRSFTALEDAAGARVAVAHTALAERLFGTRNAVGHRLKIAGLPYEIVGVYAPPAELFGEDDALAVTIPYAAFAKHVPHTRGWLEFRVAPAASRTVQEAIDDVTGALRSLRGLRPADENTFAVVTQDKLLETFHRVTGAFFVVMIALSSVGLLVGGVGVVAIMMISVTERTREIGVRKALGATRREILWQFLVEAATLTLVGAATGLVVGGLIALVVEHTTPIPATVPLWSVGAALGAAALTGVGFGLYPAARAARLDPIDALRHE